MADNNYKNKNPALDSPTSCQPSKTISVSVDDAVLNDLKEEEIKSSEINSETMEKFRYILLASGKIPEYYDYISQLPDSVTNKMDLLIDGLKFYQEHSLGDAESLVKLLSESTRLFTQRPPAKAGGLKLGGLNRRLKRIRLKPAVCTAGQAPYGRAKAALWKSKSPKHKFSLGLSRFNGEIRTGRQRD